MKSRLFPFVAAVVMVCCLAACRQPSNAEQLETVITEAFENIGTYDAEQWNNNFRQYETLCRAIKNERGIYTPEQWEHIEALQKQYDEKTRSIYVRIGLGLDPYATDEEMLEAMGFQKGSWFE